MKQDRLERFIKDNKVSFDTDSPPPMVWLGLEKQLSREHNDVVKKDKVRPLQIMRIMQVAAMFVVVLGVGLLIGIQLTQNNIPLDGSELHEFVETEKYYNGQIDDMMTLVNHTPNLKYDQIQSDMEALDQVYNELKLELIENGGANAEVLIDAMINNYRNKIEILETVLDKYQSDDTSNEINIEDEKIDI